MKSLLGLILFVLAQGAWAQSVELHVMLNGTKQVVNDAEVVAGLTEMVESASVDTTEHVSPAGLWDDVLAAPTFIHVLFNRPRPMQVWKASNTTAPSSSMVREIAFAFPGGRHILLKTDDGLRTVAKYSPCALEKVITAAKLDSVAREQFLLHLRDNCKQK